MGVSSAICLRFCLFITIQGVPGSVRFGYGLGMERFERFRFSVPAVPLRRGFFCVSAQFSREARFRFRFRFLENGSGGSGSAFGSWENGSDSSGFQFRSGSWATLAIVYAWVSAQQAQKKGMSCDTNTLAVFGVVSPKSQGAKIGVFQNLSPLKCRNDCWQFAVKSNFVVSREIVAKKFPEKLCIFGGVRGSLECSRALRPSPQLGVMKSALSSLNQRCENHTELQHLSLGLRAVSRCFENVSKYLVL